MVFVPAPKGLVKEIASRFVCVLGFRRFSGYRNRNNRLTSSQEFSRCFAAGDCADHCRSEYGTAALEDTSSTKIRSRKRRVPIAGKKSPFHSSGRGQSPVCNSNLVGKTKPLMDRERKRSFCGFHGQSDRERNGLFTTSGR